MEEEITLEEIFAELRKELGKVENPPLSFSTQEFMKEVGLAKTSAHKRLGTLEAEGKIKRLERYWITNSRGIQQPVEGWQWIKSS